ncbi:MULTISPECIES: hypothetical protein [unclassified Microcoleus]|uniref:hypothetical protein n=1 Tax=unclassified Microcoleus TaxID=2642155 RepID=UPI004040735A
MRKEFSIGLLKALDRSISDFRYQRGQYVLQLCTGVCQSNAPNASVSLSAEEASFFRAIDRACQRPAYLLQFVANAGSRQTVFLPQAPKGASRFFGYRMLR